MAIVPPIAEGQRHLPGAALLGPTILILLLIAAPALLGSYRTFQLTIVIINAIAILGLNILTGYNGQISIGHSAFFALGAYTLAILTTDFGVPYWVAIVAAAPVCFVAGFLFGLPALRLGPAYIALATFALALTVPQILKFDLIEPWTRGTLGMSLDKPVAPFGLPIAPDQWLYYVCLATGTILFLLARNLLGRRIGDAIVAVRDQPIAAAAAGISVPLLKTKTFGTSAMFTGIAGALSALATQYVAPDGFTFFLSISLLVGVIVGGSGTVLGSIYGALFITVVPELASQVSKAAPDAIYGLSLLASAYLLPTGIYGLVHGHLIPRLVRR